MESSYWGAERSAGAVGGSGSEYTAGIAVAHCGAVPGDGYVQFASKTDYNFEREGQMFFWQNTYYNARRNKISLFYLYIVHCGFLS